MENKNNTKPRDNSTQNDIDKLEPNRKALDSETPSPELEDKRNTSTENTDEKPDITPGDKFRRAGRARISERLHRAMENFDPEDRENVHLFEHRRFIDHEHKKYGYF